MKRSKKLAILVLLVGLTAIVPLSCAKPAATPTPTSQPVTVQQGPLIVQIPASGNLAFSLTADVAFQGAGTVDQINVQVGDAVTNGEVLATLDQSAWQDYLTVLQRAVTTAQRNEFSAEIALNNASQTLQQALNGNQSTGLQAAQDALVSAQNYYQYALSNFAASPSVIANARAQVDSTTATLNALVTSTDSTQVTVARMNLTLSQGKVDDAKNAVSDAQKTLDDANTASPQITAPFDGIVTAVGVTGGQTVTKGTVGVSIADQTKFEANVLVNETDISNVKIGAAATVQPNANSTVTFAGTVTAIAPTATISSGVVNYSVTVAVAGQPVSFGGGASGQGASRGSGQPPSTVTGGQGAVGQGRAPSAATSSTTTAFQLKSGLTVSINILALDIPNAILVPSRAISRQAGQSVVKLLNADGTTVTTTVTVGATNGTNTQIVSGLSVGDKVLVLQSTGAATPTAPRPGGGGGFLNIRGG